MIQRIGLQLATAGGLIRSGEIDLNKFRICLWKWLSTISRRCIIHYAILHTDEVKANTAHHPMYGLRQKSIADPAYRHSAGGVKLMKRKSISAVRSLRSTPPPSEPSILASYTQLGGVKEINR